MNRVLSAPHTPICPGLLSPLKSGYNETSVTDRHTVRFELPLGPVEMSFASEDQRLAPGTPVVVWLKGGGFVCATVDEMTADARQQRAVGRRVDAARARLEAARQERFARDSALSEFDMLAPPQPQARIDSPLLGA